MTQQTTLEPIARMVAAPPTPSGGERRAVRTGGAGTGTRPRKGLGSILVVSTAVLLGLLLFAGVTTRRVATGSPVGEAVALAALALLLTCGTGVLVAAVMFPVVTVPPFGEIRWAFRGWRGTPASVDVGSWPSWSLHEGHMVKDANDRVRARLTPEEYATALVLSTASELPLGDLLVMASSLGPDA